MRFVSCMI